MTLSSEDREALTREVYRRLYPGPINLHDSRRCEETDAIESDAAYQIWDEGRAGWAPPRKAAAVVAGIESTVEAITARAVTAALEAAADALDGFDVSDDYHRHDYQEPGYYSALRRAKSLLRGEISGWTDPPPPP